MHGVVDVYDDGFDEILPTPQLADAVERSEGLELVEQPIAEMEGQQAAREPRAQERQEDSLDTLDRLGERPEYLEIARSECVLHPLLREDDLRGGRTTEL